MMPVGQQLPRFRRPTAGLPAAGLGVVLLFLLFLPTRDPVTHSLAIGWRPSAEFVFLLFIVSIAAVAWPQIAGAHLTACVLAVVVGVMVLLNLVHAVIPTLLGRDLNLYWDLGHLPSLFGLAWEAAGFWRISGVVFLAGLGQSLTRLETALRDGGYTIASNRLISPTFGGGSWLAHATFASGVRLDDPVLYTLLMDSRRKLLPAYFKEAGWRTIGIAPGVKTPSSNARAWGFDREVYAGDLDYHGPAFGWFEIPDQFTLNRTTKIRSALGSDPPVFTQVILVSSHIPFSPVPPYLADWNDSGTFASVSATAMEQIYRQPDWSRLAPEYLKSLCYDFAALEGWLTQRVPGDGLVIVLGDHQPPAVIGGLPEPPWTVPIHVLSRDPDLLAPFIAEGYVSGLFPAQKPPYRGMETFLSWFLTAFDHPG
jgi:hypothetical protein